VSPDETGPDRGLLRPCRTEDSVNKIAIIASLHRRRAAALVRDLVAWLEARGVEPRLRADLARRLHRADLAWPDERLMEGVSLALSMGGDGTMLSTARLAASHGIPILGCNLGGFGFLTELAHSELMAALPEVLAGNYRVRDRMMLQGDILCDGDYERSFLSLNDIVITRAATSRLLRLEIRAGADEVGIFSADGVIVSTPTGSTAYSLSAGGPVVSPEVEALVVTPICAHTLSARPMILPSNVDVSVLAAARQRGQQVLVITDGQEACALENGDMVRVSKAPVAAHIVEVSGPSFLAKVRTKLGWAGRS
jgi:NAD+ kinase